MSAEEYALENMQGTDLSDLELALDGFSQIRATEFIKWVRVEDYYFVKKQQKWFNAKGELLTEEELYGKFLNNAK